MKIPAPCSTRRSRRSSLLLVGWALAMTLTASAYSGGVPFLRRQDVVGIWRLTRGRSLLPSADADESGEAGRKEDIVVRLNGDGTFDRSSSSSSSLSSARESSDEVGAALGRGGTWQYDEDWCTLTLAADRPENADSRRIHDTILSGKLVAKLMEQMLSSTATDGIGGGGDGKDGGDCGGTSEIAGKTDDKGGNYDVQLSVPEGQVAIGKFVYPKRHKAFFEDPMLFPRTVVGTFALSQLLGNLNARIREERERAEEERNREGSLVADARFHKRDFYGKKFYLTSTPVPVNPAMAKADRHYDPDKATVDLRVFPIEFHSNDTFTATGSDKIMRGRFGISGDRRDSLWFQVNLFGAGRSAPGSVYSEGRGLTHDDRRGYHGVIQEYPATEATLKEGNHTGSTNQTMRMFVEGSVYYGNELGRPVYRRPNPTATFTMKEITNNDDDHTEEDMDRDQGDDDNDSGGNGASFSGEDAFQ